MKKVESTLARIKRLEIAAAINYEAMEQRVTYLEARIKQLEQDKTKLVREIQKLKNAPSKEEKQKQDFIEMYRNHAKQRPQPLIYPQAPAPLPPNTPWYHPIIFRQTDNPPCILDDSIPSNDKRIC